MFDITTIAVSDTAAIHITDAAGVPLYADEARKKPCRIVIYGPSSPAMAALESAQTDRAIKRAQDGAQPTTEQRIIERAEDLASITVEFENFDYPAGDKKGREKFIALYSEPKLGFIAQKIYKSCQDWGNFKPGSAGN